MTQQYMTICSGTDIHIRQVAALTEYPELIKLAPDAFPSDVVARAQEILNDVGSIGAYSHSQGIPLIRKHVAEFIQSTNVSSTCLKSDC